ncbi:hypothetical protein Q9966_015702 [Columba livia]|nr:hypothetical protein Q9966_015702 [Columba livia]
MVCGGFACSRNALCALNVVYVLVALLLIAVAAWGRGAGGAGGAAHRRRHRRGGRAAAAGAAGAAGGGAPPPGPALLLHDHPGAGVPGAVRGLLLLFGHRPQPPGAAVQLGLAHPEQRDARGAGAAPGLLRAAQPQRPPPPSCPPAPPAAGASPARAARPAATRCCGTRTRR